MGSKQPRQMQVFPEHYQGEKMTAAKGIIDAKPKDLSTKASRRNNLSICA
jgi:hypothetical protein